MLIADLHIHSKYSRATSKECVPEHLELWARRKGINLVGTGDFTHPAWREELAQKLVPAEEGLYTLNPEYRLTDNIAGVGLTPRFVVTGEISSIYKKNGRVRKVHSLILLPGLEDAERLARKLEQVGNIHSDGRPILGLDCRDLLELTLESSPRAIFVPAHIWTPHFSLFGAFSGFDSIEECFGDLTPYIHALETGLSSDPPMNWRVSALERYHLISNSDAHSPAKLGREANLLDIPYSYSALANALQAGASGGLKGTIEFFPEEGKYHYDGHRNCHQCLKPTQADAAGGICPVCGKRLTIGVLHRVEQLADRPEGFTPQEALPFENLIPLPEAIGGSTGLSATGVRVQRQYEEMLRQLGPEFSILRNVPIQDIERVAGPCVAEGIKRMRQSHVQLLPGYDGEYGKIELLSEKEIDSLNGQITFFAASQPAKSGKQKKQPTEKLQPHDTDHSHRRAPSEEKVANQANGPLTELNPRQQEAVACPAPAVSVIAGPGTGKTKTLIARILYLIQVRNVEPSAIMAVTFTRKAAEEIRQRLKSAVGTRAARLVAAGTFHSLCLQLLERQNGAAVTLVDENQALWLAKETVEELKLKLSPRNLLQAVSRQKNGLTCDLSPSAYAHYCEKLEQLGVLDFDDLLLRTLAILENPSSDLQKLLPLHLLVDEFQDINPVQYRLIRALSQNSQGLFVIGDPDQAIYSFRGSDSACFTHLASDYPALNTIRLTENYRSTPQILRCALPVPQPDVNRILQPKRPDGVPVRLLQGQSDLSAAIFIAKEINRMVGGIDMLDAQGAASPCAPRGFSDIAILYRTHRCAEVLEKCLRQEGIPYVVSGRDATLEDPAVQGCLGFFHFLQNPSSFLHLALYLSLLHCPVEASKQLWAWFALKQQGESQPATIHPPEDLPANLLHQESIRLFFAQARRYSPMLAQEKPQAILEEWLEELHLTHHAALQRLASMSVFYRSMEEFLASLTLGQEGDVTRSGERAYLSDAVSLTTLHGSKGLEYPVVFLFGVQEGLLPLQTPGRSANIEEERRLLYVGMTRARDELVLLSSGQTSSLLLPIQPSLYQKSDIPGGRVIAQEKQLSFFDL